MESKLYFLSQRRESQDRKLSHDSAEVRKNLTEAARKNSAEVRQRKSVTDSIASTKEVTFKVEEPEDNTETEAIEQMLDDINQKLQESADEIVQVRFAIDEQKPEIVSEN